MKETTTLTIERLGINGEGVAKDASGRTVFVEGALPGETVEAVITEQRKSFARAVATERAVSSKHRVDPVCPLFGTCGGCQLMHLEYGKQLEAKRHRVIDALERIGKFSEIAVLPCEPSPSPLAYRNKIQLPSINSKLGLYAKGSHDLVEVEKCFIHCSLGEKVYQHIQTILKGVEVRHVLIKTAVNTQQVLVVLVTREEKSSVLQKAADAIMSALPEIKGVVHHVNNSPGNGVLSGGVFTTLCGQGTIEEKLCSLFFKVSPASFFQVNPDQAENIYKEALDLLELTGKEVVLDAYCGVGTLSLVLAQRAKEVIGIECVEEAISDALQNAERNGIKNTKFVCGEAEKCIASLKHVDAAVINPPRKGCERSFLEQLALLAPPKIIYVSCDPATLARDAAILSSKGYRIDYVKPFDMFPQTAHVETLMRLSSSP